jgi:hypothetical protein
MPPQKAAHARKRSFSMTGRRLISKLKGQNKFFRISVIQAYPLNSRDFHQLSYFTVLHGIATKVRIGCLLLKIFNNKKI